MSSQNISILPYILPKVTAGNYKIEVSSKNNFGESTQKVKFRVSGYLHNLPSTEIVSVYPPKDGEGNYAGCFPMVQFSNGALPWFFNPSNLSHRAPYLFLALFKESEISEGIYEEGKVQLTTFSSNALVDPPAKSQEITYLIVPDQYLQFLPTYKQMTSLSHVRSKKEVIKSNILYKETSIVISKRMVKPATKYRAFVCAYINNETGKYDLSKNESKELIILSDWKFESSELNSFQYNEERFKGNTLVSNKKNKRSNSPIFSSKEEMEKFLNKAPIKFNEILEGIKGEKREEYWSLLRYEGKTLRGMLQELKFSEIGFTPNHHFSKDYKELIDMGKVPLLHQLKSGGKVVSWYQGPFTKLKSSFNLLQHIEIEKNKEDKITIVPDHAEKLIFFNNNTKMLDMTYASAWQIGRILALNNLEVLEELKKWKHSLKINELIQQQNKAYSPINIAQDYSVRQLPQVLRNFVLDLLFFKNFPYYYLFPDQSFLPLESIKYFRLDNNWLLAMLFAIFSIGKNFELSFFVKYVLNDNSIRNMFNLENSKFGFVIHSDILEKWPDIAINYNEDISEFNSITEISSSTKLFFTTEKINKISLFQKAENSHFAIDFPNSSHNLEGTLQFSSYIFKVDNYIKDFHPNNIMPFALLRDQPKVIFNVLNG